MMRRRFFFVNLLTLLLLIGCAPVFAGVYKWTDADGVTHFAENPPEGTITEGIRIKYSRSDPDAVLRLADQVRLNREAHEARVNRRDERNQQTLARREQNKDCANARNHRKRLVTANRLFRINDGGVRERVDESARTEDLNRIDKAIKQLCS